MKPEDVMKALECCSCCEGNCLSDCPLFTDTECYTTLSKNVLALIREKDEETYELVVLPKDLASLIPYPTLKLIQDTLSDNSISTYIYLLNRYYANDCKPFQFTLEQVKSFIGISTSTRSNDEIITNILFVLNKIGLIRYSLTTMKQDADTF